MKSHTVFYAGLLYAECSSESEFRQLRAQCGPEIYNGAYLYYINKWVPPAWFRMDLTPVLLDHVPKELRVYLLLL